jgi:integrase
MPKLKLSKSVVAKLSYPKTGQVFYWDTVTQGFGLRVGAGSKVYIIQGRANGRSVRFSIGSSDYFTAEKARNEAKDKMVELGKGKNLNAIKRNQRMGTVTLEKAFNDFLDTRELKPRTISDYTKQMNGYFKDWQRKQIADISRDMCGRRHKLLGDKHGHAQANQSFRFLRSLFNFCIGEYDDSEGKSLLKENPVLKISQTKAWFKVKRRQTIIKGHQLPDWYKAVQKCPSETIRDYIKLLLLTGLRRAEGFSLNWNDVDLEAKVFTVLDTKNSKPLALPIGKALYAMLKERKKYSKSEWVFPGNGKEGHLTEPKKQVASIAKESKVPFTLHDLRRGFITTAESMDISSYAVKQLVNHSTGSDVTGGYIISDPERLRQPMQKIETRLLSLCKES